ncbi:lipoyl(octanoyl) transferase LipB, partial [Balneolaceae bacterium ANBcel3]|nr:lipoyl(octanoyl) transferase LipB [Balneolaceae bacterium ANBcel3]
QNPGEATTGNIQENSAGFLLFVEHPHVYTLGKSANIKHLLFSEEELSKNKVEVIKSDRGGDITYHGPGQLVGYPVLDLEYFNMGVGSYIHQLEEVIIGSLSKYGISAGRIASKTGVWVDNNKICAFGIKCSRYVCMHGFALNIFPELRFYQGIIPCGISDGGVTSIEKLTGVKKNMNQIQDTIVNIFEDRFEVKALMEPAISEWLDGP